MTSNTHRAIAVLAAMAILALVLLLTDRKSGEHGEAIGLLTEPAAMPEEPRGGNELRSAVRDHLSFGESRSPAATAVPSAGPQLRVTGRVIDASGEPVGGAEVELRLLCDDGPQISMTRILATAEGRFDTALEGWGDLSEASRSTTRVAGRASAALFRQPEWTQVDGAASASPDRPVRLDLVVERGFSMTGRVVTSDGRPTPGAVVWLRFPDRPWAPWRRTDVAGSYAAPIRDAGTYRIAAIHSGEGYADVLSIHLGPGAHAALPDLVLHGPGAIAGTALYPDGRPAGGLRLEARSTLPGTAASPDHRAASSPGFNVGAHGLLRGTAVTDPAGRFRFRGLEPGSYSLHYDGLAAALECDRDSYATDDADARLTVRVSRVRLAVLDRSGKGVVGARYDLRFRRDETHSTSIGGTIRSEDGVAFVQGDYLVPGADARVDVEAWTPVTARTRMSQPLREGQYETRFDLYLERPLELGTLRLSVRDSSGGFVPAYKGSLRPSGRLSSETLSFRAIPQEDVRIVTAAPGEYLLVVRPEGDCAFHFFARESRVDLAPGEVRELEIRLPEAGSCRMRVFAPPEFARSSLTLVGLSLNRLDGGPATPWGRADEPVISGTYLFEMIRHCARHSPTSSPYSSMQTPLVLPGWYRLRAEFKDCVPADLNVYIRGRQITETDIYSRRR